MRSKSFLYRPSPAESTVVDRQDDTLWLASYLTDKATTRLIHMNLSSVQGFHALADLGCVPNLDDFASQVCCQRLRQCRELCQLACRKLAFRPISRDPAAAELRRVWWVARSYLTQGRTLRSLEQVEMAELILEHAYRAAAATERNSLVVGLYREHIAEIFAARRRFAHEVSHLDF